MAGDHSHLYVANSDFDLRYDAGSVQSIDLARLRELVPRSCRSDADCGEDRHCDNADSDAGGPPTFWCVADPDDPCGSLGERLESERFRTPGRCGNVELDDPPGDGGSLVRDAVQVKALAADIAFRADPSGEGAQGRLFVPVRGDASLHYIESDRDGGLSCGESGRFGMCDAKHRVDKTVAEPGARDLELPPEPTSIAVSASGDSAVVTHESESRISLFVDGGPAGGPRLEYVATGLPRNPMFVAEVPAGTRSERTGSAFLVSFRGNAELQLFQYFDEQAAAPDRPFLELTGRVALLANSSGSDSRGIAIADGDYRQCLLGCSDAACEAACDAVPVQVYLANRSPSSLLVGNMVRKEGVLQMPTIAASVPLPLGPSRVVVGSVIDRAGQASERVFIVCFESRKIGIYDPASGSIEHWTTTGRGPSGLVIDVGPSLDEPEHALAYVSHFTDSYLGVIQLDQRSERDYGEVVLSLGQPSAPEGMQ